ncbi:hypothetical protein O6H91_Y192300 [Diphasiastrum complanatum]|nr:hypothetical protein O6H91_Y192300 [Diphasiastrum complanatum]
MYCCLDCWSYKWRADTALSKTYIMLYISLSNKFSREQLWNHSLYKSYSSMYCFVKSNQANCVSNQKVDINSLSESNTKFDVWYVNSAHSNTDNTSEELF